MNTLSPRNSVSSFGLTSVAIRFALLGASVFFIAALLAYLLVRTGQFGTVADSGGFERIRMPIWFWFSTLTIMVSSVSLWGAKQFTENRDPRLARRALRAATALGFAFLILQIPGFVSLLAQHRAMAEQNVFVYAPVAILFGLHAAHVLGGIVPLTVVTLRSSEHPLDEARIPVLRHLGWYWHYLTVVWIVMFHLLWLVG